MRWNKRHPVHHLFSSIFNKSSSHTQTLCASRACVPQANRKHTEQPSPLEIIFVCDHDHSTLNAELNTTPTLFGYQCTRHDQNRALLLFWCSKWSPAVAAALPDTFKMEGEMSGSPTLESPIHQTIVTGSGGPTAAQAIWNGALGDTDTSSGSTVK